MADLPETKKALGQHWLSDEAVLLSIAACADIKSEDTVLEIGPGPGTLTRILCEEAAEVVAVELDEKLARDLPKRVPEPNLRVVQSNIMSFDLTTLAPGYKLVANIPYYLTSNLIRNISVSSNPPEVAVLLIQKEVAERATAKPGKMSLLSVATQLYWDASLGPLVTAEMFTPPPKVDSQVLVLKLRKEALFPDIANTDEFFRLVRMCFAGKRKTLSNSLSAALHSTKAEAEAILLRAGINPGLRAQELALDDWHNLFLQAQNLFTK